MIQIPSIGRVVHFTGTDEGRPIVEPAIITDVAGYVEDSEVDLVVFRALSPGAGVGKGRVEFLYGVKKANVTAGRIDAVGCWNWPALVPVTRPEAKQQPGVYSIDSGIEDVLAFLALRIEALEATPSEEADDPYVSSCDIRTTRADEVRDLIGWLKAGEHVGMAETTAAQRRQKRG